MTPSATTGRHADDLRRSLDRAVHASRCGRLLAACGCWLAAASGLVAALATVDLCTGGRIGVTFLPPAVRIAAVLAAAAVPAIAVVRRRLVREGWPDRLKIAVATEAQRPRLGETLSRAVAFLDDAAVAGAESSAAGAARTSAALRQLAIDQAATAARETGGPVVPGVGADLRAVAAGIVTAVAVWLSTAILPGAWAAAVHRQLTAISRPVTVPAVAVQPPPAGTTAGDATALPPAVRTAAERLALAAALERRLVDVLAASFARSPGIPAASLPHRQRHELDELAAIQADCMRTITDACRLIHDAADSATAAEAQRDRLTSAVARLDELDLAAAESAPGNIAANRLQLAGAAAATMADVLAAVAAILGTDSAADRAAGPTAVGSAARPAAMATGPLAHAARALERIAAGSDRRAAADSAREPAAGARAGPAGTRQDTGQEPGSAPSRAGQPTAATTQPAGGAPAATADTVDTVDAADGSPLARVWSRLPATRRSQDARTAVGSVPPAYRPAIDSYYRLLLQSMTDSTSARPDVPPP